MTPHPNQKNLNVTASAIIEFTNTVSADSHIEVPLVKALEGYEDMVTKGWVHEMSLKSVKAYIRRYNAQNSCNYRLEESGKESYTLYHEMPDGGEMECIRRVSIFRVCEYIHQRA